MRLKVLTILGTRPEIVRLSRIINKLNVNFNHILVNTGQNYIKGKFNFSKKVNIVTKIL